MKLIETRRRAVTRGIAALWFLVAQVVACDVGRSVLAPIPDATVAPFDVAGDGADGSPGLDATAGTRTCTDFAMCVASCTNGTTYDACVVGCGRDIRPSSRRLVDDLLTCVRASCDGGINDQCATMAVNGRCMAQGNACLADGAPPDGGTMDVPAGDAAPPPDVAPNDVTVPIDLPVGSLGCVEGIAACLPSCPERDIDCFRRCASGMRAASMATFNNLLTCASTACGSLSSFFCFQVAVNTVCTAQLTACMMDSAGTAPAPSCSVPWESRCGADCVNTSYRNTAHCGRCGVACTAGQTCSFGECVPHGNTSIALQWDALGDVDLVVRTPCGDVVSARRPSACGATFDRSSSTGIGPESVSFAAAPRTGQYSVCAIPRTTLQRTMAGARVLLDRTGMPLVMYPTSAADPTDRTGGSGMFRVLPTTVDTTTDDCDPTGPFHIATIDL
jgi:hypothetical protein